MMIQNYMVKEYTEKQKMAEVNIKVEWSILL